MKSIVLTFLHESDSLLGFINVKGMEIALDGRYDRNPAFREQLGMINDC